MSQDDALVYLLRLNVGVIDQAEPVMLDLLRE